MIAAGYRVGIVGNQPRPGGGRVQRPGPGARLRGLVGELGRRQAGPARSSPGSPTSCGSRPSEIAYVGDRVDNDVRPAAAAGMVAIFIRRGPWGWIQAGRSDPPEAAATIESLSELPGVLAASGSLR